jgi:hypothetical protein
MTTNSNASSPHYNRTRPPPKAAALQPTVGCVYTVRNRSGVTRYNCSVIARGAGGNLVSMAAALVTNPALLHELSVDFGLPHVAHWQFPRIERLCCLYGLLSQSSVLTNTGPLKSDPAADDNYTTRIASYILAMHLSLSDCWLRTNKLEWSPRTNLKRVGGVCAGWWT